MLPLVEAIVSDTRPFRTFMSMLPTCGEMKSAGES